ncbi:MAG TPA: hypothetical protein VKY92_27145 [Verrucomicrobiae bacterium]|nr:hypothetical protein [Verrucomicrobiae bacterium]
MNSMSVALFSDRAKAEPLKQRLTQAGFNAQINEHPGLTTLWFVARPAARVRIEVPGDQFERAEQTLLDWDAAEGALSQAIRCPECNSFRIEYPQYARNSLLTNLGMGIAAMFGLVERDYYCEDCHFTWPREGTRPRRNRPHLAPWYFIDGVEQTQRTSNQEPHEAPRKAA